MTQATELRELATLLDVSSGNVGIGLPSGTASNKLVISDGVRTSAAITAGTTALEIARTGGGDVGILINKDIAKWLIGIDNSDGNAAPLRFMYGAYNAAAHPGFGADYSGLNLTYDGKVGIGTKVPNYELHVKGAGDIKIEDSAGGSAHLHITSSTSGLRNSEWRLKTSGQNDEFYIDHRYTANDGSNDVAVSGVDSAFKINSIQSLYNDNRQPTVRPILNLDFAKSKELDPRIMFYRDSIATYYDSKGIIRYANTNEPRFDHDPVTGESKGLLIEQVRTNNLLSHFNTLTSDQGLLQFNAAKGLDGTYSAYTLTRNGAASSNVYWRRSGTISFPDNTMLLSMYVKPIGTCDVFMWSFQSINSAIVRFGFELSGNGSASVVTAGNGGHSVSIEAVRDGWYHCKAVVNAQSSGTTAQFLYAVTSFSESSGCAVGSGLTFWGGQLESGDFSTSYIPPDTRFISRSSVATYYDETGILRKAPANSPRYGYKYDGRNWVETGLILEKASTNRYTSAGGTDTIHSVTGSGTVITNNYSTAPDGSSTALRFQYTNAGYGYRYWPNVHGNGVIHTHSFYVKPVSGNTHVNHSIGGTPGSASWVLNFDNQTTTQSGGNGTTYGYTYEKLADGWWRVSISFSLPNSTGYVEVQWTGSNNPTEYYLWGMQVEDGLEVSSFMRSLGFVAATRSADVVSSATYTRKNEVAKINNINYSDWYNTEEGAIYVDFHPMESSDSIVLGVGDGTSRGFRAPWLTGATQMRIGTWSGSAYTALHYYNNIVPTDPHKSALSFSYLDNTFLSSLDGSVTAVTSSWAGVETDATTIWIGSETDTNRPYNGHIRKVSLYNEALSTAELQALTENN
jgi:hypothetical protein